MYKVNNKYLYMPSNKMMPFGFIDSSVNMDVTLKGRVVIITQVGSDYCEGVFEPPLRHMDRSFTFHRSCLVLIKGSRKDFVAYEAKNKPSKEEYEN